MYTPDDMKVIVNNKFGNNSPEEFEDSCGCGSGCGCHDEEDYSGFDNNIPGEEGRTTESDNKSGSNSQDSVIAGA